MALAACLSLIIADSIVVAVTWWKTFRHSRLAGELGLKVTLSATLFRDGTWVYVKDVSLIIELI